MLRPREINMRPETHGRDSIAFEAAAAAREMKKERGTHPNAIHSDSSLRKQNKSKNFIARMARVWHNFGPVKNGVGYMRYLVALLCFAFSWSATAADMSHEETMVRTFYAKLAYAAEQDAVGQMAIEVGHRPLPGHEQYAGLTSEQRLAAADVRFTLSNFVVGDIQEILNRKVLDVVSSPEEEVLITNLDTMKYTDADVGLSSKWTGLRVHWEFSRASEIPPEAAAITIDQLYSLQWNQPRPAGIWQRYASYTVVVTFQGKTRGPYRALFIFGHDAKGDEVVEPIDENTDVFGLVNASHETLFPDAFVSTRLRIVPVVANWLQAKQSLDPSCSVGKGDVCCDLVKLTCGPGRADVIQALAKPLPSAQKP